MSMRNRIAIVDLFSGPGGLGEGFSSFRDQSGGNPFSVEVSVEKDEAAHATLRLRSFLRKFGDEFPDEYYEFLNNLREEPEWWRLYPDEWRAAEKEALCMELGAEDTSQILGSRIADIRKKFGDRTVLIGGPPCQAYSVVGRSRNSSIAGYLPHKDDRNFLYQKYVDVLRQLEPAAFVMENVKGMLSHAIKGDRIFHKVMSDLRSAAGPDSYRLLVLSPESPEFNSNFYPAPKDFVVRMEEHGVPQSRHRVIIVGLRNDIADKLSWSCFPRLVTRSPSVTVGDIIGGMPRLRSGLSPKDNIVAWGEAVADAIELLTEQLESIPAEHRSAFEKALSECADALEAEHELGRMADGGVAMPDSCPEWLARWIVDPKLVRLANNETRSHMHGDLSRYIFVSCFGQATGRSPKASEFPAALTPNHRNWRSGKFADRFKVQVSGKPASTITSHISKDGHYFIHHDPSQFRSLTVREVARLQTFPDNYFFKGSRTQQYVQVGNAVPPFLALQIAESLWTILEGTEEDQQFPKSTPLPGSIEV